MRSVCERRVRRRVDAVAVERDRDPRDGVGRVRRRPRSGRASVRSRAPAAQLGDRLLEVAGESVSALTATIAGSAPPGNALLDPVDRRDGRRRSRAASRARTARCGGAAPAPPSRAARPRERPPRSTGCRSAGVRIADQTRFSPRSRRRRPMNGMRPFSTRSPSFESSAGSTVSEPSIATATTIIVAIDERHVRLVAAEEHPGHRDHHRHAGDQHRAARGRGGGLERGAVALARRPLLTLALEVEERVVDADREADEQEHGADVLVHRDEVARQRDEADRRRSPPRGRAAAARRRRRSSRRRSGA